MKTGGVLQFSLWSRNLLNEQHAFLKNFNASLGTYGIFNEPRTFGVEANVKF
jgi:iron complex outermembrane receptor protein